VKDAPGPGFDAGGSTTKRRPKMAREKSIRDPNVPAPIVTKVKNTTPIERQLVFVFPGEEVPDEDDGVQHVLVPPTVAQFSDDPLPPEPPKATLAHREIWETGATALGMLGQLADMRDVRLFMEGQRGMDEGLYLSMLSALREFGRHDLVEVLENA
jgi:hypothetical protein